MSCFVEMSINICSQEIAGHVFNDFDNYFTFIFSFFNEIIHFLSISTDLSPEIG